MPALRAVDITLLYGRSLQNGSSDVIKGAVWKVQTLLLPTADQQYQDAFNDELESFKERVRGRAKIRIEKAMKEYEEEEKKKRLGPGGLDPVDVYDSLPSEMQKCFDEKDIQMLQDAISKMDPTEAKYHMKRCIDSGLWVPNSRTDDDGEKEEEKEEEPQYEELKTGDAQ
ncbi:hypothetical protein PDJAM_G00163360 [Pangasius djambal]|uniref:Uncharacterized protein n=1 Tax=Pangasius djambal TaxID=1691987 RepID=A0ACC5ZK70_9TELE|nr:hypothetical protein [Pangasius djambal]